MEETLIKAFNCADSLPRCCFIWHLKVGRAALRSPPASAARRGEGGKGLGFSPPSLFPGTLAFNESCCCSSTANLLLGFEGREGKGSVVLFKQQQKNTHNLRRLKKLINKWPRGLGPEESSPFHLAPAGLINPLSHFVSRALRAPTSPVENCARGSCLGKGTCCAKALRNN